MRAFRTIEELIDSLFIWNDVHAAYAEVIRLEKESTKNYEVMKVPDRQDAYIVSESRYWEVLSRKGYTFLEKEAGSR